MNANHIRKTGIVLIGFLLFIVTIQAQGKADSLARYLELAARNNPLVNSNFMLYKASMEKIPQAGAYPDPELEIGFFLKPMEIIGGKQIADFTLMQMFPWFGTRKAAQGEATEMVRMAYEKFRESRDNLYYDVKSQWYQLNNLGEQYRNLEANIQLLIRLEELALNRFSASSAKRGTTAALPSTSATVVPPSAGGMAGMGDGSAGTVLSGMGSGSANGMSDVLRIQMERIGLENDLENLRSARLIAEAKFNALLNRSQDMPVSLPDSLEQRLFLMNGMAILDSIQTRNPMLAMLEAEGNAYRAKAMMDKRMSYPMLGIGLQYSLIGKTANPMGMPDMNGKDMLMPMFRISLPLFRGKYNAQQRESKSYWTASELKHDNVRNLLRTQYFSVSRQLEDTARKIDLYTRQYALSLSVWQLIVSEFTAGSQPLTEVLQVERQMLDYQLKRSEAIASYNTIAAEIEKLMSTSLNTTR